MHGDAAFKIVDGQVLPTERAVGPWEPDKLHGAPVSALLAHAVELVPAEQAMQVVRLTCDLLRPVPLAPLGLETEIIRQGRRIQLVEVSLRAGETLCARMQALRVRISDAPTPDEIRACDPNPAAPNPAYRRTDAIYGRGFNLGIDLFDTYARQDNELSRGAWIRFNAPFIAGIAASPLMRAVAAGDFIARAGPALDRAEWTFINADNSLHLTRPPRSAWIYLDGSTVFNSFGAAFSSATLSDRDGLFGRCTQSLMFAKRKPSA